MSTVRQKYISLLRRFEKLDSKYKELQASHAVCQNQLSTLYFLLRKVVALVPYDAPEVSLSRKVLDGLSSAVEDYMEYRHDLAMEQDDA